MTPDPIAIVGRACILPNSNSPETLWENLISGKDLITAAPPGRWRIDMDHAIDPSGKDASWTDRGGYVTEKIQFGSHDFDGLDPLFHWTATCARDAMQDAGWRPSSRTQLILANLSYPSETFSEFGESIWFEKLGKKTPRPDARNAKMSGLPAHLTSHVLGLGDAFSLDAACASALYAIKLAAIRLQSRAADAVLVGAVNRADPLFIHHGFSALQALSRTGRSRPFHPDADGLVPAEGCAFLAVKRLIDVTANEHVYGVVRNVGLSNDGRARGFLAPAKSGQVRAMINAYRELNLSPKDVGFIECHATGTQLGDRTELESIREVFGDDISVGSHKSNLGHAITVAGMVGVLKGLGVLQHGVIPPTLHCDGESPNVPTTTQSFAGDVVGINAFGFGGNNAHLVLAKTANHELNISPRPQWFVQKSLEKTGPFRDATLALEGLKFPPRDLEEALPQQVQILQIVRELLDGIEETLDPERTGFVVGMSCDLDVTRFGARWRWDGDPSLRDRIVPQLSSAGVIGVMPNIVANRLNAQFDFRGPSFAVSSESLGELDALLVARDLITSGDLDHVVVASFDAQTCRASLIGKDASEALAEILEMSGEPSTDSLANACASITRFSPSRVIEHSEGKQTRALTIVPKPFVSSVSDVPTVTVVRGDNRAHVAEKLRSGDLEGGGPATLAFVGTDVDHALSFLESGSSRDDAHGCYFRERPIDGGLAFVFTGAAAAYEGMFRGVDAVHFSGPATELPEDEVRKNIAWTFGERRPDAVKKIWSVSYLSHIHADIAQSFLPRPTASLGFSLGESNMLLAFGAWHEIERVSKALTLGQLFTNALAQDYTAIREAWSSAGHLDLATKEGSIWTNWTIVGPVDFVVDVVQQEPLVHVAAIVSPNECVVSGESEACERILVEILNNPKCLFTNELVNPVAIHVPEVLHAETAFRELHTWDTRPVDDITFYTNATNAPYEVSKEACADVLFKQATETVEFRSTVQRAYEDGVRVFVEVGPKSLCTGWIDATLEDQDHIAVSMDRIDRSPAEHWCYVAAELLAGGVDVDLDALRSVFRVDAPSADGQHITIRSWPEVSFPEVVETAEPIAVSWPKVPDVPGRPTWMHSQPPGRAPREIRSASRQFSVGDAHAQFVAQQAEVYQTFLQRYVENQNRFLGNARTPMNVVAAPPPPMVPEETKPDTSLTREQLEFLSRGKISKIWGEAFTPLDDYDVLVRMPEPPLLLADRVMRIDAEPASMKPGNIVTQTDITDDAWYLNCGRMPAGIMIESGQADLLLVSYLGVDLLNRGERAYRLLGCKLTYHDELPEIGETLQYDISIDGFAKHGDVRLFFFHYDCHSNDGRRRLSVRDGQAGFFTDEELLESGGVLWTPEDAAFDEHLPFEVPTQRTEKRTFSARDVREFAAGRPRACFGESHAYTDTHTRSPGIWSGDKLFFDDVTELDFNGGPIGRGYFRAEAKNHSDAWFFDGHFHNDPCMPGTLMFEGCLQTMAFFMAAAGQTIDKDGWRFEPVPNMEFHMRCRGQCVPESEDLVYELFVEGIGTTDEGYPVLFADLLVTVDGLKAFHCRRMALRLVPDWIAPRVVENQSPGTIAHGNYPSLLATAIGRPSDAFGEMYQPFDGPKRAPRLPGPPYHFMSRVTDASRDGSGHAVVEYDVPPDAWYFEHTGEMPFAVLLETGLQPCGWLASYVGCAAETEVEVFFRNLDGTGTLHDVVLPTDKVVTTKTTLTKRVRSGDVTLVSFDVEMTVDGRPLYTLETMFGFFPAPALAEQKGLEGPDLPTIGDATETTGALESDMLRMVDAIEIDGTHVVGQKTFDPANWFFKAHFFQDPVQPGSLGLEALLQCVRAYALEKRVEGTPRVTLNRSHRWSYRGQVRPHNRQGTFDVTIKSETINSFVADGWLFVDGLRIYEFEDLAITFE